uniref:SLL1 protein n=1 Tax=Primula vulgaris TaxID=175104 RepID=A5X2R4_9ERIC|nr:SLL1 protein [Primula vulgaris]
MAMRSCASKLFSSSQPLLHNSASRGFHATGAKRMSAHGHDGEYYLHAKRMYNLDRMKYQKLTMSLAVLTAFSIGVGVPVFAVVFQQKKTASG